MSDYTLHTGDCLAVLPTLADCSVHCCVTSPPFFGLRDYGNAGQIGLEQTPEEFVAKLVAVFREVRRALRDDGTLWLNLGDSYNAHPNQRKTTDRVGLKQETNAGSNTIGSRYVVGLKPKDLIGIPWMVAFALRVDGWYLRQDIIWAKPNPMPESVRDRCTKAHEYIFLLSKSERYYYDAEAIKEKAAGGRERFRGSPTYAPDDRNDTGRKCSDITATRNKRSVWTVASESFAGAHFATFPTKLIEPCILAGTSERGCCPTCGAPLMRVVEKTGGPPNNRFRDGLAGNCKTAHAEGTVAGAALSRLYKEHGYPTITTTGWRSACDCEPRDPVPCVVLDPFTGAGTGTTWLVAKRLGRGFVGVELNPEYAALARERVATDCPPTLFDTLPLPASLPGLFDALPEEDRDS